MVMRKACSKCGEVKALGGFYVDGRKRDGYRSSCAVCDRARASVHRNANREKINAASRAWRAANRAKIAANVKARYYAHPEKFDANQTRYRLGLTYEETLRLRQRPCAICASPPGANAHAHHIDHDHNMTGKASVRGILCTHCNTTLGRYEKGHAYGRNKCPAWRASADAYLNRHQLQDRPNHRTDR